MDNSKGLAEVQPALGANRPVPVGKAAVVPLHSVAPISHAVHAPVVAAHAVHAPLAHHGLAHGLAPAHVIG